MTCRTINLIFSPSLSTSTICFLSVHLKGFKATIFTILGAPSDHGRGLDSLNASGGQWQEVPSARHHIFVVADKGDLIIVEFGDVEVKRADATTPSSCKIIPITRHILIGILASMSHFSKKFMTYNWVFSKISN